MSVSAWAEIWDSTLPSTPVDPSDLAPTRDTLTITSPRPNSEYENTNRAGYTHSQVPYEFLCGVYGGRPPFTFAITGIPEATIEAKAPPRNPSMTSWGIIRIPAGIEGTYTVTVTDQDDAVDTVIVNVVNDDSKFVFVDSTTGLDPVERDGSFNSPYKDFNDLQFGDKLDDTYEDSILTFLDAGPHYLVPNAVSKTLDTCFIGYKPKKWIGVPGIHAKIDGTNCQGFLREDSVGNIKDSCFINLEFQNSQIGIFVTRSTARFVACNLLIHDIDNTTITEDEKLPTDQSNIAGISLIGSDTFGNSSTNHIHRAFADIGLWNFFRTNGINNNAGILTYGNWYSSYDYIYHKGISAGGGQFNWSTLLFRKSSAKSSATSCFAWYDGYNPHRGTMFDICSIKALDVDPVSEVSDADCISLMRYCLWGSDNVNKTGVQWCYSRNSDNLDQLQVGYRYMDRCTSVGASILYPNKETDFRNQDQGYGPYASKVISISVDNWFTPPYFNQYITYDTESLLLTPADQPYPTYIDQDGNTVGLNKYKIGWEVK